MNIEDAIALEKDRERFTVPAQTKLTPSQADRVRAMADANGISFSQMIRAMIVSGLGD